MVSRSTIPSASGNLRTTNSGGTQTTTTGPSSSSSNQSSSYNQNSSSSSSSSTTSKRVTESQGSQTTTTQNMDAASLQALQDLIQSLAGGGTEADQLRRQQIQEQIAASRLQEGEYSKDMAFSDASRVANAQSEQALQQLMPTINAGIDAAGTSGSAMASLLAQDAANQAANLAAELSLQTAVQYGQIKNQAMGNTTDLLQIEDQTMSQLLEALNIAKGATTSQTVNTKSRVTETGQENTVSSGRESSSGTSFGTSNTFNSGGTQTTTTSPSSSTETAGAGASTRSSLPGLSTPSSYSAGNRTNPYVTIVGGR